MTDSFTDQNNTQQIFSTDLTGHKTKNIYCCSLDRVIHAPGITIVITAANKETDQNGSKFIAYCISFGNLQVKRRYSEFASLRKLLCRLYPTVIVPPIPEKHTLVDYATKQGRAKDDVVIIEKRKRMLGSFLNRVATHPILSTEHIFHQFIDANVIWGDLLKSETVLSIPKRPITVPPKPSAGDVVPEHTLPLPIPRGSVRLRKPDVTFQKADAVTDLFIGHLQLHLEPDLRRISKKLSELGDVYSELGALYNGFSLTESDQLAVGIERVGQAIDTVYLANNTLKSSLESDVIERVHEYTRFASIIKSVLRYRHQRHWQVEYLEAQLQLQRHQLDTLLRADAEAQRLAMAQQEQEVKQKADNVDENTAAQASSDTTHHEEDTTETTEYTVPNYSFPSEFQGGFDQTMREGLTGDRMGLSGVDFSIGASTAGQTAGYFEGLVAEENWSTSASTTLGHLPPPPPLSSSLSDDPFNTNFSYTGPTFDPLMRSISPQQDSQASIAQSTSDDEASDAETQSQTAPAPEKTHQPQVSQPNTGILGRISSTFTGLLDVDPDATRRSNISRTQRIIALLEQHVELTRNDLTRTSAAVQQELDRFQRYRKSDFRDIMLAFARMQIKWCQQAQAAWEQAKEQVDQIPTPLP